MCRFYNSESAVKHKNTSGDGEADEVKTGYNIVIEQLSNIENTYRAETYIFLSLSLTHTQPQAHTHIHNEFTWS